MRRVTAILGTRPDAIKLAPVITALGRRGTVEVRVLATSQHREILDQVLSVFHIAPDWDLSLMRSEQTLADLASRTLTGVHRVLCEHGADLVLVQGDTTTAVMGALAAFYAACPVGHVEAGLRSFQKSQPYPEEMNRRLITTLADLHFAPTEGNRQHLLAEAVAPEAIFVTGNTVIDTLLAVAPRVGREEVRQVLSDVDPSQRLVVVTVHRRESFGPPLEAICAALLRLAQRREDIILAVPVHPNPQVHRVVVSRLGKHPRIRLLEPLDYRTFVALLKACYFILTDSGGIQEEGPALGKPVLVLREVTERPEGIETNAARLVGRDPDTIVAAATQLLDSERAYQAMARAANPYGDGRAAGRIADAIEGFLRGDRAPQVAMRGRPPRE